MNKKVIVSAIVLFNMFSFSAFAANKTGNVDKSINVVQIDQTSDKQALKAGSRNWQNAVKGQDVFAGDKIRTGLRSVAQINYEDGTMTRIGSRSLLTVKDKKLNLKRGYMWGKVDKTRTKGLKVFTANAIASIIGTEFFIEAGSDGTTTLTVLEGIVELAGKKGKVSVTAGTSSVVDKDGNAGDPMVFDQAKVLERYSELLID